MKIIIAENEEKMAQIAADIVQKTVEEKPNACLGLATGSSPISMYRELVKRCEHNTLDLSHIHTVNLDEYVGLPSDHVQSYRYFMDTHLFDGIHIPKNQTFVAKGDGNPEENLKEFAQAVTLPRDLQILGVGNNGHIGFNEPGSSLQDTVHIEKLTSSTISANARFFDRLEDVPTMAMTMGMKDILSASRILLLVSKGKEEAARHLLLSDDITPFCPVTYLKTHKDVTVILLSETAEIIGISHQGNYQL